MWKIQNKASAGARQLRHYVRHFIQQSRHFVQRQSISLSSVIFFAVFLHHETIKCSNYEKVNDQFSDVPDSFWC